MPQFIAAEAPLTDAEVKSRAPAYASIARSLFGRVRKLAELVTGLSIADTEQISIVLNPQGRAGIDKSGPPWGPAWRHPLMVLGGMKPDTSGAGEWCGHRAGHLIVTDGASRSMKIGIPVRAHDAHDKAPYSRGFPIVVVYQTANAAASDLTVTCRQGDVARTETFTMASSLNEQTFECTDAYWSLVPGDNLVEIELSTTHWVNVSMVRLSVNNTAKLSH